MRNLFILFFLSSILSALQNSSTKENRNLISFPKDIETNTSMNRWLNSHFGLEPYKENYLLLLGYRKSSYKSYIPTDVYTNVESELQISLKLNVKNNILGLDEKYYLSYSHHSFWQIYSSSSPFRETIYNPEAFVIFPISDSSIFNLSSLKIAMAHRSNGQGDNRNIDTNITEVFDIENRSRSINYFYTTFRFKHETLITDLEFWARVPEDESTDDNPDYTKYTGFSSLKFRYFIDTHMFTLFTRLNFKTGYGAVETTYSHPLIIDDTYFYTKVFSGYGESLIDYNNKLTKFSIGFSFSR